MDLKVKNGAKKYAFLTPQRSMVFADGLEIEFFDDYDVFSSFQRISNTISTRRGGGGNQQLISNFALPQLVEKLQKVLAELTTKRV